MAKDSVEVTMLVPLSLKFWGYRHILLHSVYAVLGIKPRASYVLSQCSIH